MKYLTARLIPIPPWARAFADERDGDTGRLAAEAFAPHMSAILTALHSKVETFLNDPEVMQTGSFPERERLTGEYYWGDRSYTASVKDGRLRYRLSIMTRCLERLWVANQAEFDYLGLEADVFLWPDTGQWEVAPEFNTSVI